MKLLNSLVAIASLLSFGTAQAETGKPADNADKKICREVGPPTGSILPRKRACHTRVEWAAIDKANSADTRRFQADRERSLAPDAVRN